MWQALEFIRKQNKTFCSNGALVVEEICILMSLESQLSCPMSSSSLVTSLLPFDPQALGMVAAFSSS